jgi:hypothetical protein
MASSPGTRASEESSVRLRRKGAFMPNRFDKFIHDENIKNFSKQIETETDPVRLALLKTLLSEERAARVVLGPSKKAD